MRSICLSTLDSGSKKDASEFLFHDEKKLDSSTVVDRFSRHRFSRNPDLVENFAVTNHFYSIKIQYSRKFDLVD